MVGASNYLLFYITNLSQVDGFLKYEPMKASQENEVLRSTTMVIPGPCSFGFPSWINKFIIIRIISPRTPHTYSIHGSDLVCYFYVKSLHQFYVSHDRIEAWLEEYYSMNVPMNYHYEIINTMNRVFGVLIFPTFTLLFLQVPLLLFFS